MKELVIDRATWHNATYYDKRLSALYVPETNTMCCLGFLCEKIGIDPQDMENVGEPVDLLTSSQLVGVRAKDVDEAIEKGFPIFWHTSITGKDRDGYLQERWVNYAVDLNDDPHIIPSERERRLIKLFGDNGWNLSFTGEYPANKYDYDKERWEDYE